MKKFLLLLFGFFGVYHFCAWQTDGFSIAKIQSNLSYHPEWEAQTQNLNCLFDQPYHYLKCGAQTFAFVSEDGNYVLKFYRHHRASHPLKSISFLFPAPLKKRLFKTLEKRENKRLKDFSSYRLAHELLQKETGLVYLHLNKTSHLKTKLIVYDKIHVLHDLDLDRFEFIVQKKADLLYPTLEKWIANEEWETAEKGLSELVDLLYVRCKKEIFDKDPDLKTNFGFLGNHPIQIDIGRFKKDSARSKPEVYQNDLIRITDRLCIWLEEKAPRLSEHLRNEVHSR